jgi:ABC-type multidrug transport system fused ATPase/permease subunit
MKHTSHHDDHAAGTGAASTTKVSPSSTTSSMTSPPPPLPRVTDAHMWAVCVFNAVIILANKWSSGCLLGKLIQVGLSSSAVDDDDEEISFSYGGFYNAILLNHWSFESIAILALVIVVWTGIASSAMTTLSVLRAAATGRRLRQQVLLRRYGGTSGNPVQTGATAGAAEEDGSWDSSPTSSSSLDAGIEAQNLVLQLKVVEDYQANDEAWLYFSYIRLLLCILGTFIFAWYAGLIGLGVVVIGHVVSFVVDQKRQVDYQAMEDNAAQVRARLTDVIKNSVLVHIMGMSHQEATDLRNLEVQSNEARAKDAWTRFVGESVKLALMAAAPILMSILTWPILHATDPRERGRLGTALLIAILLLEEAHKSQTYLLFLSERSLDAARARTCIQSYIGNDDTSQKATAIHKKVFRQSSTEETEHSHETCTTQDDVESGEPSGALPPPTNNRSSATEYQILEQKSTDSLVLQDIHHIYPGHALPALNRVSHRFTKGQIHGLIGESGSGKSTLLKVVAGLVHPSHGGTMTVWEGKKLAYIAQDQKLFARSIRENVCYGDDHDATKKKAESMSGHGHASDQEIWDALEQANIASWVQGLPNGLDEVLVQGENTVSGGQRQRLALAHLFLTCKDADLILLDECLSALDEDCRDLLIGRLQRFLSSNNKTTLLVTHHKEMLRICHQTHVMATAPTSSDTTPLEVSC